MNAIDGIIYGQNPREGFAREGTFYHPDLEFRFPVPANWQVINEPSRVVLARSRWADAVIIMQIDSESSGPQQSVQQFVNQEGITLVEQSSAQSGSLPAYQATASAATQDNTELGLYVYAVEFQNNIYRFISYTTKSQFQARKATFCSNNLRFYAVKRFRDFKY
ncbi:MAG: hypothetical protein U5K69_19720 [Balneolaceae bacterium]|nr:hypothetical protein [Balneolaceae bacterium]